jgi:sugar phosphate isomerase/epimerase
MKIGYAFRRAAYYPFEDANGPGNELPPKEARAGWLKKVRQLGFEGLEIGVSSAGKSESDTRELRRELEGEGLVAASIRGGGGVSSPRLGANYVERWRRASELAAALGAKVVNSAIGGGHNNPGGPGADIGERTSQGSSRLASQGDYELTASRLREAADIAADHGVTISIEMHQHSIADNAWSCLHLLQLIDRPNVGINPDLGNLYWTYERPEEQLEGAIKKLAPRAVYWHCKQLLRVHVPEQQKAYFLKVPLPDGEIDYRFALSAMVEANYQGYLMIEGCREGDQLYRDGKSVEYVTSVLRELGQ